MIEDLYCSSGIETRRILTRSKTGSLTPKQFTDSITTTTSSLKMSGKSSADDVLVINKDGEISRITRSKTLSSSSIAVSQYFRLGKNLKQDMLVFTFSFYKSCQSTKRIQI